jgi:hypothetical protein
MKLDFETDLVIPEYCWKILLLIVGVSLGWNKSSILLIMGV